MCILCVVVDQVTFPSIINIFQVEALEKMCTELDLAIEVYVEGRGSMPPRLRPRRPTVYVCVTEKAVSLLQSLLHYQREKELGLIVVDEIHLLDCSERGCVLESLLALAVPLTVQGEYFSFK